VRALIMTKITRSLIGSAALTAAIWLVQMPLQPSPASAAETDGGCGSDCEGGGDGEGSSSGAQQQAPPVVTGADSSGASIGDLAKQHIGLRRRDPVALFEPINHLFEGNPQRIVERTRATDRADMRSRFDSGPIQALWRETADFSRSFFNNSVFLFAPHR